LGLINAARMRATFVLHRRLYKMYNPQVRIRELLAVIVVLTMAAFSAVAETDKAEAAADPSVAVYAQGMTWDEFLAGAKVQRDVWLQNVGREAPPALVERFKRAGNGLSLLIVTADWCPDSAHSVPYIAKLATEAGVEVRVVDFRTGKSIMDAHRTPDGRASTPTVILLRGDKEVASWVERPASLQWWYLGMADETSEKELLERKMSWYDWNRGADALNEIVVLAEKTAK